MEVDLRKVVAHGRTLNLNSKRMCMPFKCRKLPKICFKCGKIVHGEEGCEAGIKAGKQTTGG